MTSSRSSVLDPLGQLARAARPAGRRSRSGRRSAVHSWVFSTMPRSSRATNTYARSTPTKLPMSARAPAMHVVDLVGRPVDERRRHPGEEVLEGEPLAQGVEGVAAVLGVAEHDRPVARPRRAPARRGRTAAPRASRRRRGARAAGCRPRGGRGGGRPWSSSSWRVVGREELDQVVAEHVLLVEPEQRAHGGADVADRAVGGHGEHHVADLGQRLVELHAGDQRADAVVGAGRSPRRRGEPHRVRVAGAAPFAAGPEPAASGCRAADRLPREVG